MMKTSGPILVFDLELNQPSEAIIELGFVIGKLETAEIIEKRSIFVNPAETLHPDIIELTGISQEQVDTGVSLAEAYKEMVKIFRHHKAMAILFQWGISDAYLLRKQIPDTAEWLFGRRWIDVKALAQVDAVINNIRVYGGLKKFARRKGISVDSKKAHRADYDAEITFMLLSKLADKFKP